MWNSTFYGNHAIKIKKSSRQKGIYLCLIHEYIKDF